MPLAVLGLGTALPAHAISQERAAAVARVICCRTDEHSGMLASLYQHSGIATRHLVIGAEVMEDVLNGTNQSHDIFVPSGGEKDLGPTTGQRMRYYADEARPLALRAARQALARSGLAAREITHLVTVSCTGFAAPGVDVVLIKELELSATVERTHVGFMGCHGAINGLRVARAYADSIPEARILLCAVELCSLHFHYQWNPKKNIANALFADGAAALVGMPAGAEDAWRMTAAGSCLFPDSEYAMTWHVGDHGFDMMLSARIPELIGTALGPWLARWLAEHGLAIESIRSWAVHPGGPRILNAVEECLALPAPALAASRAILAECGNMSSPTVLFILDRLRALDAPRPCVALGFGPGLVAEAALFE